MKSLADDKKRVLLEKLAENNDELLIRILDDEEISILEIKKIIRE